MLYDLSCRTVTRLAVGFQGHVLAVPNMLGISRSRAFVQSALEELQESLATSEARLADSQEQLNIAEERLAAHIASARKRIDQLEHDLSNANAHIASQAKSIAALVGHKRRASERADARTDALEASLARAQVCDRVSLVPSSCDLR